MSGPYDQYNGQYGAPQHNQQYPPQSHSPYPPQQGGYEQGGYQQPGYPPQGQSSYPPHQGYDQGGYNQQYGAPAHGGFQHGQQVAPYDQQQQRLVLAISALSYNQQQGGYPGAQPHSQFPQQGAYPSDQYPQGQHPAAHGQPGAPGYGPTDPNAQAEGDRGLLGALGGGAAGYFGGNKMGGHGIIGAIAGAVLGSKLEDKHKHNKPHH
ncbi:hypothetical protein ACEQ8H_002134 [Pleosporales sp. CAS-2024a]